MWAPVGMSGEEDVNRSHVKAARCGVLQTGASRVPPRRCPDAPCVRGVLKGDWEPGRSERDVIVTL